MKDKGLTTRFPKWKPQYHTSKKFEHPNFRIRYSALRTASSNFTRKKEVLKFLLEKHNGQCVACGHTENLQIDHMVSVYQCATGYIPVTALNSESNLQILCERCHYGKRN